MRSLYLILPALLLAGPAFGQAVIVEPGGSLSHTADLVECLTTPEEVTFDARRLGSLLLCSATVRDDTPYELKVALSCDPDRDPMTGTAIFTFGADGTRYSGRVRLEGKTQLAKTSLRRSGSASARASAPPRRPSFGTPRLHLSGFRAI